ncbi:hypothetical protein V8C42DRAFT_114814 [Trichoderma barbatum]
MTASERPRGQEHIPDYPKAWIWMRVLQIVTGLIVLFLSIHALEEFHVPTGIQVVMIVIATFTVGVSILLIIAQFASPRIFRYWVPLGFDFALIVAWAVSTAVLIAQTSNLVAKRGTDDGAGSRHAADLGRLHEHSHPIPKHHVATLYAIAGIGCLEFCLFFISWATDAIAIKRHRAAGFPCKPIKKEPSFPVRRQTKSMQVSPPTKARAKKQRKDPGTTIFGFGSDGGGGGGGGGGCDGGGGGGCDGG